MAILPLTKEMPPDEKQHWEFYTGPEIQSMKWQS